MFFSAYLSAQAPTGKIFGIITDEQGTPLPGVSVEATSPKLIGKATAISDEKGVYRVFALTPGFYKVTFVLKGFKTFTRDGIIVEVEQSVKLQGNGERPDSRRRRSLGGNPVGGEENQ